MDGKLAITNQDIGETTKKPRLVTQAKEDGKSGSSPGSIRRSFDQNDAILGQSFSEFKSDIKKEVSDVHSKISNMEDLDTATYIAEQHDVIV